MEPGEYSGTGFAKRHVQWSGTRDEINEVEYRTQKLPERRKEEEKV